MGEPETGAVPTDPLAVEEPSYDLTHLPWPDVQRILGRDARLLLAVGSLDQHGPHLPLGAGALVADRVVAEASRRARVLRAPTLRYGVSVPTSGTFAGMAGIRRKTLHRVVNELLADWEAAGVRELVLVTANRYEQHLDALLMALSSEASTTVVDLRAIPVHDIFEGDPASELGGEMETSLLLHLAPDRVHRDRIRDFVPDPQTFRKYLRGRTPTPPPGSEGVVGQPTLATEEKGRRAFERYVEVLVERVLGR